MFPLINKRTDQRGMTLIELLAVIVLISIISIFIFRIFQQTSETTNEVLIESRFRDEADIIVSLLMKSLYETNANHIIENQTNATNSYLHVTMDPSKCRRDENGKWLIDTTCKNTFARLGFVTENGSTKLLLKNEGYQVQNKNIRILSDSKIIGSPTTHNTYEVILKLEYSSIRGGSEKTKTMEFRNTIQPY